MRTCRLDSALAQQWGRLALRRLIRVQALINEINLFPVPDADTGTNLVLTLQAGWRGVPPAGDSQTSVGAMVYSFAQASMKGARGSSGVIFSQMALAWSQEIASSVAVDAILLRRAMGQAALAASDAVHDPQEGTMVSLARITADAVNAADASTPLTELIHIAANAAKQELQRSPLAFADPHGRRVVDAGAYGLVVLLEALRDVCSDASDGASHLPWEPPLCYVTAAKPRDVTAAKPRDEDEVMYLLGADQSLIPAFRRQLAELGRDIAVSGINTLWQVHVHTTSPSAVLALGRAIGHVHQVVITPIRSGRSVFLTDGDPQSGCTQTSSHPPSGGEVGGR
ncbi:MAG: DAK2 domain-containing protein [Actinomycetota bacterium]